MIFDYKGMSNAIHLRNAVIESKRYKYGDRIDDTKVDYDIKSDFNVGNKKTVLPYLAYGKPDHIIPKTSLPKGTLVEYDENKKTRYGVVVQTANRNGNPESRIKKLTNSQMGKVHNDNLHVNTEKVKHVSKFAMPRTLSGKLMFFAEYYLGQVSKICKRFLMIEDNNNFSAGSSHTVISLYLRLLALAIIFFVIIFITTLI